MDPETIAIQRGDEILLAITANGNVILPTDTARRASCDKGEAFVDFSGYRQRHVKAAA